MKEGGGGLPETGPSARMFGVRPAGGTTTNPDVLAANPGDLVSPGQGGMSVVPQDPSYLPKHRRPTSLGGIGIDPVWKIDLEELGPNLQFRQDSATHGFVEPKHPMILQEYQDALAKTQDKWQLHCKP
jgi:hypothetical protein